MAEKLYYEFIDMDFMDYAEDYESDIAFINTLLCEIGEADTRKVLEAICYG